MKVSKTLHHFCVWAVYISPLTMTTVVMLSCQFPSLHLRYWNIIYYCYRYCLVSMNHHWFIITMSLLHLQAYYYSYLLDRPFSVLRIIIMEDFNLVSEHLHVILLLGPKSRVGLRHSYCTYLLLCSSQWRTRQFFPLIQQKYIRVVMGMIIWATQEYQTLICYLLCKTLLACIL